MEAHDSASLTGGSSRAARVAAVMPWAGLRSRERPVTPVGEQAEGISCASSWQGRGHGPLTPSLPGKPYAAPYDQLHCSGCISQPPQAVGL